MSPVKRLHQTSQSQILACHEVNASSEKKDHFFLSVYGNKCPEAQLLCLSPNLHLDNKLLLELQFEFASVTTPRISSALPFSAYCRNLHFTHEVLEGWALQGHGIKPIQPSGDEEDCQLKCYFEERCVSYNYGNGGCELNESDHIQSPHDLIKAAGTLYRASQVGGLAFS